MANNANRVVNLLKSRGLTVAFAESCTGGLLSKLITDVPGASEVFPGGVCAYSNEVKRRVLGVSGESLARYGAVSAQVAREMAEGVRRVIAADVGVGTTGIAGPASDNTSKPVGLVYVAVAVDGETHVHTLRLSGGRDDIRRKTAEVALRLVCRYIA